MEQQIMRHAMALDDIAVSSVYWRLENASAHQQPDFRPRNSGSVQRLYKTIEVDELAAFKARRARTQTPSAAQRQRSGSRVVQAARLADMVFESPNAPGLNAT
jgi:hypothetical protein